VFTLPHNSILYLSKEAIQWTVIGFKPVGLKWTVIVRVVLPGGFWDGVAVALLRV
jgi:hypothetical protein